MRDQTAHPPRPLLLLVDDDAQIRALLSEVGIREGFEVLDAADGAGAIEMLQRRHMDLVLGVSRRKLYRLTDKYAAPPAP